MTAMEEDRISAALKRIEAAASRIEAAARSPQAPIDQQHNPPGDPELERKYAELRGEAAAALTELDRLIGSLTP